MQNAAFVGFCFDLGLNADTYDHSSNLCTNNGEDGVDLHDFVVYAPNLHEHDDIADVSHACHCTLDHHMERQNEARPSFHSIRM